MTSGNEAGPGAKQGLRGPGGRMQRGLPLAKRGGALMQARIKAADLQPATPTDAADPAMTSTVVPAADPKPAVAYVPPPLARPARLRTRHRGLILSFLLAVCLPVVLSALYLGLIAQDRFASTVGFTVRQEQTSPSSSLLGGLSQLVGGGAASNTDILYQYIQSQEIVSAINETLDLERIYSQYWPMDPVFALWPDPSAEDLLAHWVRMVTTSYDGGSQLMRIDVMAYTADDAQRIAQAILDESQKMINALNQKAREDIMRYANEDVEKTIQRLKAAREAISAFRASTRIMDPQADIQGRMGVLNNLQQQLAEALIENDIVLGTTQASDPRREQAARRIQVIQGRIAAERANLASDDTGGMGGETYPRIIAEFERLTVDLQFAEETYRTALAARDAARDQAARETIYLAAYIQPTLPQTAEYPQRIELIGLIALFLTLSWTIGALIFYAVRDRQ